MSPWPCSRMRPCAGGWLAKAETAHTTPHTPHPIPPPSRPLAASGSRDPQNGATPQAPPGGPEVIPGRLPRAGGPPHLLSAQARRNFDVSMRPQNGLSSRTPRGCCSMRAPSGARRAQRHLWRAGCSRLLFLLTARRYPLHPHPSAAGSLLIKPERSPGAGCRPPCTPHPHWQGRSLDRRGHPQVRRTRKRSDRLAGSRSVRSFHRRA